MGDTTRATGFVGAGAVGSTLARALSAAGYPVAAVFSRSAEAAERLASQMEGCSPVGSAQAVADACGTVVLAVPDDGVAGVAGSVRWRPGQAVVHCSGATPLAALDPARQYGAQVGALHPLQTLPGRDEPPSALEGIAFAVEAEPPLQEWLEALARDLGGWPVRLSSRDRALYHASAVAVCGLLATLVRLSADLWQGFDGDSAGRSDEGLRALLPLARGTVESIARRGLPAALTGPQVRGDVGTVRRHLEALREAAPGFEGVYRRLALASLPMARSKGSLDPEREADLARLLAEDMEPVRLS